MPLQRRLPKRGFHSRKASESAEVRLHELAKIDAETINPEVLKAAGIVSRSVKLIKVILSGKLDKAVTLRGLAVTKGARAAVEALGGKIEE